MNDDVTVKLFLDKRRVKENGKFPLKICVYQKYPKKQKYFPTKYEFTDNEYNGVFFPNKDGKAKNAISRLRDELGLVKKNAREVADKIVPFNFDLFEKKLYSKKGKESDVFYQYDLYIEKLKQEDAIKTASNYECSKNAFIKFQEYKKISEPHLLDYRTVNVQFLNEFEKYYLDVKFGSISTVGSYTRPLRAIFNIALESHVITESIYPFGKGKYIIPSSSKVKKAITKEQLNILYYATPLTKQQEIAKDYWFFSYMCNGMNGKDICLLRNENITNGILRFNRAKTIRSKRTQIRSIAINLTEEAKEIIQKYSVQSTAARDYIFGKISDNMTAEQKRSAIDAFNKFISQHMKKFAASVGVDSDISALWARHSFATTIIRARGSMAEAMQCLGHSSIKVTEGYYAGFTSETMNDISKITMDFKEKIK